MVFATSLNSQPPARNVYTVNGSRIPKIAAIAAACPHDRRKPNAGGTNQPSRREAPTWSSAVLKLDGARSGNRATSQNATSAAPIIRANRKLEVPIWIVI